MFKVATALAFLVLGTTAAQGQTLHIYAYLDRSNPWPGTAISLLLEGKGDTPSTKGVFMQIDQQVAGFPQVSMAPYYPPPFPRTIPDLGFGKAVTFPLGVMPNALTTVTYTVSFWTRLPGARNGGFVLYQPPTKLVAVVGSAPDTSGLQLVVTKVDKLANGHLLLTGVFPYGVPFDAIVGDGQDQGEIVPGGMFSASDGKTLTGISWDGHTLEVATERIFVDEIISPRVALVGQADGGLQIFSTTSPEFR